MNFSGLLIKFAIIMCLASIPGGYKTKDNVKTYSRYELFRIGKAFKKQNNTFTVRSAVFESVLDLGLEKQRGHRKTHFKGRIKKKTSNGRKRRKSN